MKRLIGFALFSFLFAVPLVAATNSQKVTLPSQVQIGTTTLPAGEYKVTWTESGTSAQVTLEKRGIPPVTAAAKIVQEKHNQEAVLTKVENGQNVIESIALRNITLVF